MYLHPPWHLQVHLQNWYYLVPIWWTNLWYEVWKLDLRWIQGILQYYIFYTKLFAKCTISQQTNYSYFINFQLDLILKAQQGDLGTYVDNGEWHLIGELISYLTFYPLQYLLFISRRACWEEFPDVWLLSGALPWHHLQDQHPEEDPVLLLQPDHPVCPDCFHGGARLHSPLRFRREAFSWWDYK